MVFRFRLEARLDSGSWYLELSDRSLLAEAPGDGESVLPMTEDCS